jgi:hypothetical protein
MPAVAVEVERDHAEPLADRVAGDRVAHQDAGAAETSVKRPLPSLR